MLTLGNLARVGILLVFVGAWAAFATAFPSLGARVVGCAVLQAMSVVLAFASWRPATRSDGNDLAALCTSWAATLPGIVLVTNLAARTYPPSAGDLVLMTNLLWLVVAPYLFFTSAVTAPSRGALRSVTLARAAHLAAWLASSAVTLSYWP